MKEFVVRVRIPEDVYKRFKIICVKRDLSIPKQVAELMRKFVEIREKDEF